jgi:hypothetical protein
MKITIIHKYDDDIDDNDDNDSNDSNDSGKCDGERPLNGNCYSFLLLQIQI